MLLADSVTRLRATTTTDDYGNTVRDWGAPTSTPYAAEVQPLSAAENVVDQERLETRWRCWLYPTADVVATDRIAWDGATYEIEGDVEVWKQKGRLHHLKLILSKITQE